MYKCKNINKIIIRESKENDGKIFYFLKMLCVSNNKYYKIYVQI